MLQQPIKSPPIHVRHLSANFQNNGQPRIKFINPNAGNFEGNIRYAAKLPYEMIEKDSLSGQKAIICGSGPSLVDPEVQRQIKKYAQEGYIVVALKKAIKVMHELGYKIDYTFNMDPGAHIASPDRMTKVPGVKYIVASSSDTKLFEYLKGEDIQLFHSACGLIDEVLLYKELFSDGWVAGGGYNVTNRALAGLLYMGVEDFVIAGCDSGWRDNQKFYADGTENRPGVDMCDKGIIDGKDWHTRPDMLASGVALARVAKQMGPRMVILGDVLPEKLRHKDEDFLNQCVSFQK